MSGDPIPAHLELFDGDDTKFVRVRVFDGADVEIAGSPANVPATGSNGYYRLDGFLMPTTSYVTMIFEVFNDAGFTIPSPRHGNGIDIFLLETGTIIASGIKGEAVKGFVERSPVLKGLLEDAEATGMISGSTILKGHVEKSDTLIGRVEDNQEIAGKIEESPELEGNV